MVSANRDGAVIGLAFRRESGNMRPLRLCTGGQFWAVGWACRTCQRSFSVLQPKTLIWTARLCKYPE